MMNPLKAVLSADLPIDIDTAVEYFPDQGREQWAQDIADGIKTAEHISRRHLDQLLTSEKVMRWIRVVEALALRPELEIKDAEYLLSKAGDELQIVENLNRNTSIGSKDSKADPFALQWSRKLEARLEELRRKRAEDYK